VPLITVEFISTNDRVADKLTTNSNYLLDIHSAIPLVSLFCADFVDNVVCAREQSYLWRAVDDEGEVLEILVQSRNDKRVALKLIRRLLKKQGFVPNVIITDKRPSYGAAFGN
jgi:hypothetical protein